MLFEQYNLSRLIDRLAAAGLVERRDCAEDRRGQRLVVTAAGRALRRRIWEVSSRAIEDAIAAKLLPEEAAALAALLMKLQQPAEAGSRRKKGGE
jgi:DNA-binding MarR family transcriptional regulator